MAQSQTVKDLRAQFSEQLKTLDVKRDVDCAVISELQDFFRRRAVVEQSYSESLAKLASYLKQRHINETSRFSPWPSYSTTTIWNTLIGSTLRISEAHATLADLFNKQMCQRLGDIVEDVGRLHRQCRDMMNSFQQTVLKDIAKLQDETQHYINAQATMGDAERQLRRADDKYLTAVQRVHMKGKDPSTNERVLKAQNELSLKHLNFTNASVTSDQARNTYLLHLVSVNHGLDRYFSEEAPDVIDCLSCGLHNSLARSVMMYLNSEEALKTCHGSIVEMLNRNVTALDCREDKAHFLKLNEHCFTRPALFHFSPTKDDTYSNIRCDGLLSQILSDEVARISADVEKLRGTSEKLWVALEQSEKKLLELINQKDYDVSALFVAPPVRRHRTTGQLPGPLTNNATGNAVSTSSPAGDARTTESASARSLSLSSTGPAITESRSAVSLYNELRSANRTARIEQERFYLECFTKYTEDIHQCHVLQAKLAEISKALEKEPNPGLSIMKLGPQVLPTNADPNRSPPPHGSPLQKGHSIFVYPNPSPPLPVKSVGNTGQTPKPDRPKTSLTASPSVVPHSGRRVLRVPNVGKPKLFGGTIDEYVEATKEPIPPVPLSCIRAIVRFGMRQRGIFRVNSSHSVIEEVKTAFEHGEDPLLAPVISNDIHLAAAMLKLYFRKLSEPPFPASSFYALIACAETYPDPDEAARSVRPIVIKILSRPTFILMRFLFAFLNHVASHADENSMDAHNLSVCFAPTLMPLPGDPSLVHYQPVVIGLLTTFITHHQIVFDPIVPGPVYVKVEIPEGDETTIPDVMSIVLSRSVDDEACGSLQEAILAAARRNAQKPNLRDSAASVTTKSSSLGDPIEDRPSDQTNCPNEGGDSALEKEFTDSADELRSISDSEVSETPLTTALAHSDFVGSSNHELSFHKGDELYLYRKLNEHWWEGRLSSDNTAVRGLVPARYVILKTTGSQSDQDYTDNLPDPEDTSQPTGDLDNHVEPSSFDFQVSSERPGLVPNSPAPLLSTITSSPVPKLYTVTPLSDLRTAHVDAQGVMSKSITLDGSTDLPSSGRLDRVPAEKVQISPLDDTDSGKRQDPDHPVCHHLTPLPEGEILDVPKFENGEQSKTQVSCLNSDLDNQLAEVMRKLTSLERADSTVNGSQSNERTRELGRKLHLPRVRHTPDLVLDLPVSHGAISSEGNASTGHVDVSSADHFAEQSQDTMRKRSDSAYPHPPTGPIPKVMSRFPESCSSAPSRPTGPTQSVTSGEQTSPESTPKTVSIAARVAAFEKSSHQDSQPNRGGLRPALAPKPGRS